MVQHAEPNPAPTTTELTGRQRGPRRCEDTRKKCQETHNKNKTHNTNDGNKTVKDYITTNHGWSR
jgi:hypothetical protein